ncbi:hypothetical protein N7493_008401 [Penicillium malachiteum]|uniref:A-pheromone receptor PreA n=1 Tax=Penicillium malachiteum TaxID=1324776 RepID=A0AAD6HH44_9EURO|nr:hypothetical protein N7493_008401 [Penicillium malachiteum]
MGSDTKLYPLAVVVPLLSLIAIFLCIPPLVLHSKNRNYPAAVLICWSILLSIFNIINALLWPTDDTSTWWSGAGLCDIEVKFMVASYVAVPGALTCIFRTLTMALDTRRAIVVPSKAQRWRSRLTEILFCVIVPAMAMITHYIYQKTRYFIYSISGCVNNYDESWVSFMLAWIWPPVICMIAAYYCCLVLIRLHRYRTDFEAILRSSNSHLSKSRFLRLFLVAFTMLIIILPVEGYVMYYDLSLSLPWHTYSWSRIHNAHWYHITMVPTYGSVFFDRWTPIAMGFITFIFCGLGRDTVRVYKLILWHLGFGYCFPGMSRPLDSQSSTQPAQNSNSTTLVDESPRKKTSMVQWRKKIPDVEKGIRSSSRLAHDSPPVPWYQAPWSLFSRRAARRNDPDTMLAALHVPDQTVCTSAWAGTSQTCSSGDFSDIASPVRNHSIHVKQVISQQSEVHV